MKVRTRSYGYALATVVLALVLAWAGSITWRELRQLHRSFDSVQADAFHLSDHIDASVDDLNDIVHRFILSGHPEARTAFQNKNQDLQQWIHAHQPAITTLSERELTGQINEAITLYAAHATKLMAEGAPAGKEPSPATALEPVDNEAASILELCEKLRAAERAAQTQFMEDSRRALRWLQELLAVQIGLLVFMVVTGIVAVYRGMIGPLRVELGQSRALAARHEKLASLGTLAAGVAHEIRNPLTAINVRLHSLKKNLVQDSSEQEDALVIGHEIQRLERIVQEFLQFARPAEPKFHTVSADSLLARMQLLFGPKFDKTSIRLNLESVPDIWVQADPHQMEQVLINLVQNAAESMKASGGTITLRARHGTSRLNGRACPVVMLEVSDTGTGIPPEVRKRIFDPFFTTKEEGTGLGLAIASRIIEKHGGSLECRSEVNRGTTFVILLPHTKPEASNEFSN
jgi:signal transduction histidine kinase